MTTAPLTTEVVGREEELAAIDRFLDGPAGSTLVLEGEAGIGKTTLLLAGIERAQARGQEVLRAQPARAETSLSFAGLHDLLGDLPLQARHELPETQQHALAMALAEEDAGPAAVPSGVLGVAVLGLLRVRAAERPLLLAIDDLQWLDETSGAVLVYALRRVGDASVRLLTSCRGTPGATLPFGFEQALDERLLARLAVESLSEGAILRLLRLQLGLSLSRVQLHAVYAASGGNPFFALEFGRAGLDVDASGAIGLPGSLHELVDARLRALPAPTREALLAVAALADPSRDVLERAGFREELRPAVEAGVLRLEGGRVRFQHPLLGSAVWSGADAGRRRAMHHLLAGAVEDPEQRAWHLAATAGPFDADVARLLEAAAANARRRGAPAAAADLLDRARQLTPEDDLGSWARRAAAGAAAHAEAGHWDAVQVLIDESQARLPAGRERAAILVAGAEMRPGLEELFRQARAEAGESTVGVQARIGLAEQAALAGRWADSVAAARDATTLARRIDDRALLGVSLTFLGGLKLLDTQVDGVREIEEALAIERELGVLPVSVYESPRMWRGSALLWGGDAGGARTILEERLAVATERGEDMSAFQLRQLLILAELSAGNWGAARAVGRAALDGVELLGYAYGRPILFGLLAGLEACEGNLDRARDLGTEAIDVLTSVGDRLWSTYAHASMLFAELCAGDAPAALVHADAIAERFPGRECWWSYHQGDEIEALVLAGLHERARGRVEALRRAGEELGLPRFLAWAARGEGLLEAAQGDLAAARAALEAALVQHEAATTAFERARTLLAYGHVLRRETRRREARAALGEALAEFERLGARYFARAARAELQHVGGRSPSGAHELTGAEERVARLVAAGCSNKEVAEQLVVAVSTVEATLTRVYRKLGLSSRSQLARAFAERLGG